jgi:hypothetical protein
LARRSESGRRYQALAYSIQPGAADHRAPFLQLRPDQRGELRLVLGPDGGAGAADALRRLGAGDDAGDGGGKPVADRLRQRRRADEAEPDIDLVARKPGLLEGGDIGHGGVAFVARHGQRPQLAGLHLCQHIRQVVDGQVDAAGDEVRHGRRAAAIGHMGDVDAGAVLQQFRREMRAAAGPGTGIAELARLRLRPLDQLRQAGDAAALRHRQRIHQPRRDAERRQVAQRVIAGIGKEEGIHRQVRRIRHGDGVAIRRRLGGGGDGDGAAGARPVLHHAKLADSLGQLLAYQPGQRVVEAAGGIGHQDADRPVRPCLGEDRRGRQQGRGGEEMAAAQGHAWPPDAALGMRGRSGSA